MEGLYYSMFGPNIEIQGTTPNFCPKNLVIFLSEMGQLQGLFGN